VHRSIEHGETWPEYGAPQHVAHWRDDPRLAEFFGQLVQRLLSQQAVGAAAVGSDHAQSIARGVVGVGVSLYLGRLVGCAVRFGSDIGALVADAMEEALADRRYVTDIDTYSRDALSTVVSVLYEPRRLGAIPETRLRRYFRLGRDTLWARGNSGGGLVLAQFPAQQSIDADAYCAQVLRKAGHSGSAVHWTAYDTAGWIVASGKGRRLEYGLPIPNA
jgi:hypothetical protein